MCRPTNSERSIILALSILLFIGHIQNTFIPNRADYDAYGIKIAMTDNFLVLAQNQNDPPTFFIQFAPYENIQASRQCSASSPSMTDTFVYTVVVGKKQTKDQLHFYFAGESTNNKNGIFVGLATYNTSNPGLDASNSSSFICNTSLTYNLQSFVNYPHQEYYILGVEPYGRFTYGFSNDFIFIFDSRKTSTLELWDGNLTWPDSTFIPHAVDISENFGVISGFIYNGDNSIVKYSPMIYVINFNSSNQHPYVVDQHKPIANPDTWQDLLTNADANSYSAKYAMSVSISEYGDVLVGMQYINRVLLFSVDMANPTNLTFVSRHTNGRSLGNGKSIVWLEHGIAALIVNVYTLDYDWLASQVHIYGIQTNGYNSNSTPLSVFPNNHQKLPQLLNPVFINIVSSPSSLALLDVEGHILIFLPTLPGFYLTVQDTGTMPLITKAEKCVPGTFKNQSGIHDCTLCPTGTKNPGNSTTVCLPCSPNAFCPLASVNDVPQSALRTLNQAVPYPKSPDTVSFDEILIQNMFSIGTGRCLYISPLFWTLVVAGIAMSMIATMEIIKYSMKNPRGRQIRKCLQCVFRHTDLIGEGELWVGGLASFSVLVLVCCAFIFSSDFVNQYPIETSFDSTFACDKSIRNAKFQTTVQSLAIPLKDADQQMFDLWDKQEFLLNVDFVNTLIKCDAVSIEALLGITWSTIRWLNCDNINYTLSLSIPLPYQHISVQISIADVKTIGALRLGLYGQARQSGSYSLRDLNFYQSFYKNGSILARNLPVTMSLTKVVNETLSIDGGEADFGGIYIPTFTVDYNSLLFTADQFVRSTITSTTLSVTISETPYYVKNLQQPIAKSPEIIFQNLLFFTVCLELFGLVFLSYKLLFKPLYLFVLKKRHRKKDMDDNQMRTNRSYRVTAPEHTYVIMPDVSYF